MARTLITIAIAVLTGCTGRPGTHANEQCPAYVPDPAADTYYVTVDLGDCGMDIDRGTWRELVATSERLETTRDGNHMVCNPIVGSAAFNDFGECIYILHGGCTFTGPDGDTNWDVDFYPRFVDSYAAFVHVELTGTDGETCVLDYDETPMRVE